MRIDSLVTRQENLYTLKDLDLSLVDESYFKAMGINNKISSEMIDSMNQGIKFLRMGTKEQCLYPRSQVIIEDIDVSGEMEIHNYTGACPTLTYEVSPLKGCFTGCLYCLVTDGEHLGQLILYKNYDQLVTAVLEKHYKEQHYYYFSAKTEAFQEPTLKSGVAHKILKAFIHHYDKYPASKARLFIASKAGIEHLSYVHEGESILDLLEKLKGKVQFNTSLSLMPSVIRDLLEPNSASLESRLLAVQACQKRGVMANSALIQPILPFYLTEEVMRDFYLALKDANIINIKPEFLTANIENLAIIGKVLKVYNTDWEKGLYEDYLTLENLTHLKQRRRMAPLKDLSVFHLNRMVNIGKEYAISISICYWVREQLNIKEDFIPIINENGFQCLGYQSKLFD